MSEPKPAKPKNAAIELLENTLKINRNQETYFRNQQGAHQAGADKNKADADNYQRRADDIEKALKKLGWTPPAA